MSSVGTEHRGNWNFVGRDVVVLHRLPDSAYCPAGTAADAFVRSAGVRHVVDHDQPRDPVCKEKKCSPKKTDIIDLDCFLIGTSRMIALATLK